jgi:hypothetical protein
MCATLLMLFYNNVSKNITETDRIYISKILEHSGYDFSALKNPQTFENEIKTIRAIQDSILAKTPVQKRIPLNTAREPENLYHSQNALCGDRSRFMDKALREAGFETRFVFLYMTSSIRSPFMAFLSMDKGHVKSHAVVEVLTRKGWMVVDSVERWISLDASGNVLSIEDIQNDPNIKNIEWDPENQGKIYFILNDSFAYLYGLYSRHGRFYEPYTPIPDINWPEFFLNL